MRPLTNNFCCAWQFFVLLSTPPCHLPIHKNSLIVACCTFSKFTIRTLTPNKFKNQTNETFKLPHHNSNHHQGFAEPKNVALNHCSFKLKFPKYFYEVCLSGLHFKRYFSHHRATWMIMLYILREICGSLWKQ